MAYIPDILDYKPFYIQTNADASAVDTTIWGMVAKSNPYPILPQPKEVYKNEWLDENGDDEYNAQMYYKSIEFSVDFFIKCFADGGTSAEAVMASQINAFFDKIKEGEFKVYDSFAGLGWRGVRYAGYEEGEFKKGANWARLIFTITFKVNDPITRMKLSNDSIVIA